MAVSGGHRQIWCMALSPGQKDLAESRQAERRQQDVLAHTAFPRSALEVEGQLCPFLLW